MSVLRDEYRTEEEARFFGSDLNKFIHYHCSKEMDVINIDCLQWKSRGMRLRLIESKHSEESLSKRQKVLLPMFARCLRFLWNIYLMPIEVFTVYGDFPYAAVKIVNMLDGREYIIDNRARFIAWLNFELELDEL